MTRETKLLVHLEQIILDDLPLNTPVNAAQMGVLCSRATAQQKHRAFQRALRRGPMLVEEEREPGEDG